MGQIVKKMNQLNVNLVEIKKFHPFKHQNSSFIIIVFVTNKGITPKIIQKKV